jgi:integrase
MASVKKRADTGRWRARHRGPDGKERARDFDRKVDADRWLREQAAKVDRGEWTDPLRGRVTVGEYAQEWLRGKVKLKDSTRTTYDALLRSHIAPTWERVPLAGVRHEDMSAWVQRLHASGLSASRTRQAYVVLAQVLDLAVKARRIPANPARGVELPSLPGQADRPMRALDERQVWALADAAGDDGRLSVLVLAWCGLRFGELAGLRVRHFDVLRRELRIETALSEIGGRLVEASPKTRASVRTVPVPAWLVSELEPLLEGKGADDYLLTSPEGGPLRIGNWRRRVFDPALEVAGLVRADGRDVVRPHDLRHTCASLHIKAGTPPKVLSAMLGHASVSITLDRYGHLYPGDVHQYVDRLGELALAARADWVRTGASDRLIAVPQAVGGKGL